MFILSMGDLPLSKVTQVKLTLTRFGGCKTGLDCVFLPVHAGMGFRPRNLEQGKQIKKANDLWTVDLEKQKLDGRPVTLFAQRHFSRDDVC